MNKEYALILMGSNAMVIKNEPHGPIENQLRILSPQAFCLWHSNLFTETEGFDSRRRRTSWGKAWLKDPERRKYAGIEFFPNPDGESGTPGYLNLWRGFSVEASQSGSWELYRDHLLNNVCNSQYELFEWMFGWLAHLIQRPRERPGTALVLRGRQGAGKSIVGEMIGKLFPAHYFQVGSARYVVSNFNVHLAKCLLLQSDEAVWAGNKQAEGVLKDLITSQILMVEAKGIDAIRMPNRVRLMMTSNEDWVAPAGHGERRFCVLDVNPRCVGNFQYFGDMKRELAEGGAARLLYDLQHFDLSKVNLREIPRTVALLEQVMRTLDPLDAWWQARLMEGAPIRQMDIWLESVRIEDLYSDYLHAAQEIGAHRRRDRSTFCRRLIQLVPTIQAFRPCDNADERPHCYRFPPLAECRASFDAMIGQARHWPAEESDIEHQRAQTDDDTVDF